MLITAAELVMGDTIPGLDNAYVAEVETNDGYFSYPGGGRYSVGMPADTILITYHDAEGRECYMLLPEDSELTIKDR